MVYAYDSEKDRDADYESFLNGGNRGSSGNFVPNSDLYVPKVRTDANGSFMIPKVIWKTSAPKFGKTDDVHDLYIMFYEEDAKSSKFDDASTQKALIKESVPYKIVSGSTNQSSSFKTLYKSAATFGGAAGYVRDTKGTSAGAITTSHIFGREDDDGCTMNLLYFNPTCLTSKKSDGSDWEWKKASVVLGSASTDDEKAQYKRNGSVTTTANQ